MKNIFLNQSFQTSVHTVYAIPVGQKKGTASMPPLSNTQLRLFCDLNDIPQYTFLKELSPADS